MTAGALRRIGERKKDMSRFQGNGQGRAVARLVDGTTVRLEYWTSGCRWDCAWVLRCTRREKRMKIILFGKMRAGS